MADVIHAYVEDRLRIALTGSIPGQSMDNFIRTYGIKPVDFAATDFASANLANLFRTVRPSVMPSDIFIAVSEPSVCEAQYCCCKASDCRLNKFKITIFINRREQGRLVTKSYIKASSAEGYEDAVTSLMEQADELVAKAEEEAVYVVSDSETCSPEVLAMGSQET